MNRAGGLLGPWRRWRNPAVLALALLVLVLQEVAVSHIAPDGSWAWLRRVAFFVSMPIMVLAALTFRQFLGAWLIAAGITMNFLPMAMHGGNMPVAYEIVRDSGAFPEITIDHVGHQIANSKDIVLWRDDVRLYPLSDNIVFDMPGYRTNIYSPGDLVIGAGVLVAMAECVAAAFGVSWRRLLPRRASDGPAAVH
jgi:hypothetical protein